MYRNKRGKLYNFQMFEEMSWLSIIGGGSDPHYSLRWTVRYDTWRPKLGIDLWEWNPNPTNYLLTYVEKSGGWPRRFHVNNEVILT